MANLGTLITKKINQNKLINTFSKLHESSSVSFNKLPLGLAIKES